MRPGRPSTPEPTSSSPRAPRPAATAALPVAARSRSCQRSPTWQLRFRCSPPAESPMDAGSRPRSCSARALMGTRFQATPESLADASIKKAIIEGRGDDTERSRVLDIARGTPWPSRYSARTLHHPFVDQWRGLEEQLAEDADAQRAYQQAVASGEFPPSPVWASEAIDMVKDLRPATDLVGDIAAEAEAMLARHPT